MSAESQPAGVLGGPEERITFSLTREEMEILDRMISHHIHEWRVSGVRLSNAQTKLRAALAGGPGPEGKTAQEIIARGISQPWSDYDRQAGSIIGDLRAAGFEILSRPPSGAGQPDQEA